MLEVFPKAMHESRRIERLTEAIAGSGARVNDQYGIDASYTSLSDVHLEQLSGWADLEMLHANGTRLSDASLPVICSFARLTDLGISSESITELGLSKHDFPRTLRYFCFDVPVLSVITVDKIVELRSIENIHIGNAAIETVSLERLAALPKLNFLGATNTNTTQSYNQAISGQFPNVFFIFSDGVWQGGICKRARPGGPK